MSNVFDTLGTDTADVITGTAATGVDTEHRVDPGVSIITLSNGNMYVVKFDTLDDIHVYDLNDLDTEIDPSIIGADLDPVYVLKADLLDINYININCKSVYHTDFYNNDFYVVDVSEYTYWASHWTELDFKLGCYLLDNDIVTKVNDPGQIGFEALCNGWQAEIIDGTDLMLVS